MIADPHVTAEPDVSDDAWYESEEIPRQAMISEVQRLRRRAFARPIPVLVAAAVLTAGLLVMLSRRKHVSEAEVVLALTEGSLSPRNNHMPVDQLRSLVTTRLMPKVPLVEMIKRRHMYTALGEDHGIEELRNDVDIAIWKNTFGADNDARGRSARIGITFLSVDPTLAVGVVHDIAKIIIDTASDQRRDISREIVSQVSRYRNDLIVRLAVNAKQTALAQVGYDDAKVIGNAPLMARFDAQLDNLVRERNGIDNQFTTIASSQDSMADRISAAGLDMSIEIVEERRPDIPPSPTFVLLMIGIVAGVMALIGAALVMGSFDSRVHDTEDVTRLGLPVLGHVPGFAGDQVGSLSARGLRSAGWRRRVPLFLRWRSLR